MDIGRRLMLTSLLLAIPHRTVQLLVALAVAVTFLVVFREWKPFYEVETDTLFYVCGKVKVPHSLEPT